MFHVKQVGSVLRFESMAVAPPSSPDPRCGPADGLCRGWRKVADIRGLAPGRLFHVKQVGCSVLWCEPTARVAGPLRFLPESAHDTSPVTNGVLNRLWKQIGRGRSCVHRLGRAGGQGSRGIAEDPGDGGSTDRLNLDLDGGVSPEGTWEDVGPLALAQCGDSVCRVWTVVLSPSTFRYLAQSGRSSSSGQRRCVRRGRRRIRSCSPPGHEVDFRWRSTPGSGLREGAPRSGADPGSSGPGAPAAGGLRPW